MPRGETLQLLVFTPLKNLWLVTNDKGRIEMFSRMRNLTTKRHYASSGGRVLRTTSSLFYRLEDPQEATMPTSLAMESAHWSTIQVGTYIALPFAGAVMAAAARTQSFVRTHSTPSKVSSI
jgi:hypothetical protein